MDGATLRLLDALRGVSYPGGPHTRDALEAFARLLAGWPLSPADERWIEDLAARAELQWNGERAEPFRIVYEAAIARGRTIDITDEAVRGGALALEGLMQLPLRERAVLATACVLGFDHAEVGRVIGTMPGEALAIVRGAVALLRRLAAVGVGPARDQSEPAA
jgi:DNA-directed RNA polymerase specialized sigma24 family protein